MEREELSQKSKIEGMQQPDKTQCAIEGQQIEIKLRRKKQRAERMAVIFAILFILYAGMKILSYTGRNALYKSAESAGPVLELTEQPDDTEVGLTSSDDSYTWEEGWVRYQDGIYAYNEDILTFLVLGIDKKGEVSTSRNLTDGGQSDAIFLLIINPHTEEISIYSVDRNTMTDIRMVGIGENGTDVISQAQINVQHGFGDGEEESCELTEEAVSKLFYDLPIHGYISVNYGAIPIMNDAVGGVQVTIPEDLVGAKKGWNAGDSVLLEGSDATLFVKWRNTSIFESARLRSKRQKEYLTRFVKQAIAATKADITMPLTLYGEVKPYIVTDITVDEMTYLASEVAGYSFSGDQIYTMPGETVQGEEFEEFYPDMEALKEQMIEIFYEKVD